MQLVAAKVQNRLEAVESAITVLSNDKLRPAAEQAEGILASAYVQPGGQLLSDQPWIQWVLQPPRTIKYTECSPDGNICWTETAPDKPWNANRAAADAKLNSLRPKVEELAPSSWNARSGGRLDCPLAVDAIAGAAAVARPAVPRAPMPGLHAVRRCYRRTRTSFERKSA